MIAAVFTTLLLAPATVDVRIEGPGLMRFIREGRAVYAKEAKLTIASGKLATMDGVPTLPSISIEGGAEAIEVDPDGTVHIKRGGNDRVVGQLNLAHFTDESGLAKDGNFFTAADRPKLVKAGTEGIGQFVANGRVVVHKEEAAPKAPVTTPLENPPAVAADAIVVREFTEVEKDEYTLGMIADIGASTELQARIAAIELGTTSAVGIRRPVLASLIQAKLRAEGIDPAKFTIEVPKNAAVSRKGQTVAAEQIQTTAEDAVRTKIGDGAGLMLDQPIEPMTVPTGKLTLAVENVQYSGTRATATVVAYVDAKRIDSRVVRMQASSALQGIKPGSTIKIRVKAGGASVETTGRVRSVNMSAQLVSVEIETGAVLSGKLGKDGYIEVTL